MSAAPVARPAARPEMTREFAEQLLRGAGVVTAAPAIVIRRGYYADSLGVPGVNDVGIYDDAIAVHSPRGFWTFNANADPSHLEPGTAVLQPGKYLYCVGTHNITKSIDRQYEALVQASPVTIKRVGRPTIELGFFGINIHRGGVTTTGSEGCITIVPDQWPEYIGLVKRELEAAAAKTIVVLLTEREAPHDGG